MIGLASALLLVALIVVLLLSTHGSSSPSIYIQESRLGGRGVFAGRTFHPGDVIEICPTLTSEGERWGSATADYVFGGVHKPTHSVLVLGYGSLYNHSDDPNAEHSLSELDGLMTYTAKRTIKKGEEITVYYGNDWFESRSYDKVEGFI